MFWNQPWWTKVLGSQQSVFAQQFSHHLFLFSEEFVAHSSNVTCLSIGPSSGRVMVTGGEDKKVNMWAIGKPNVILVSVVYFCF